MRPNQKHKLDIIRNIHHETHQVIDIKWKSLIRLQNLEVKDDTSPIRLNWLSLNSNSVATHSAITETEEL